jgi:ATP-binding cassette subfamily F protein uup
LLARLFARPANLLVLDEPTNDLDIDTLELLEALLQDYAGTVILVSHDRAFLDNVVTQSLVFEGDGRLTEIAGGYGDWLAYKARQSGQTPRPEKARVPPPGTQKKTVKSGLSYKEGKELEAIPGRLEALEAEQAELNATLLDPSLYRDRPESVAVCKDRLDAIELELTALLERWEALERRQA